MNLDCGIVPAPLSGVNLKDKGYYIGICKVLEKRLSKHNQGGVCSTKYRKPFKVIYFEGFNDYSSARLREKEIKAYKGGNKFKELIKHCGIV